MKTVFLLSIIVVLTGCQAAKQNPTGNDGKTGMDSPIVISDGSTHLRHKGSNGDFQIAPNGAGTFDQVTVNDSGYTVKTVDCVGVTPCPSALVAPWTLDVLAGGTKIMTVSSADNMIVVTNFFVGNVFTSIDSSGDTNGSDIAQHDDSFNSATFTNGGALPVNLTCPSSPCKLKIHYKN